jgi:hypothetical protein
MNTYYMEQSPNIKWEKPLQRDYCYVAQEHPSEVVLASRKMLHEYRQAEEAGEQDRKTLWENYVFEDRIQVESFLRDHRAIVGLLIEAAPQVKRYFGADIPVRLGVSFEEDGSRTLQALAVWKGAIKDAKAALEAFDMAWWLQNSRRGSGDIVLDYELA